MQLAFNIESFDILQRKSNGFSFEGLGNELKLNFYYMKTDPINSYLTCKCENGGCICCTSTKKVFDKHNVINWNELIEYFEGVSI